jgi:hypothetical protein
MYIISALMTIPVAIAGVFVWPGTLAKPNKLFLTDAELDLDVKHLKATKADTEETATQTRAQLPRHILTDWKIYTLTFWDILFWNAGSTSYCGYLLWLKSLHRYSAPKVKLTGNQRPSPRNPMRPLRQLQLRSVLRPQRRNRLRTHLKLHTMVILAIWKVSEAAKWFAFSGAYTQVAMSSVLYGWANDILRYNATERSFIIVFMNLSAQSTTAWTEILVFKMLEAPRLLKVWTLCAVNSCLLILFTVCGLRPLARREEITFFTLIRESMRELFQRLWKAMSRLVIRILRREWSMLLLCHKCYLKQAR